MGAFFLRHGGLVNNVMAGLVNNVTPPPLGGKSVHSHQSGVS